MEHGIRISLKERLDKPDGTHDKPEGTHGREHERIRNDTQHTAQHTARRNHEQHNSADSFLTLS